MARVLVEITDLPNGEMQLRFEGEDLKSAGSLGNNTATQNAAIFLLQNLKDAGFKVPDIY